MGLGKVKIAILSSTAVGFVAGGVLMGTIPAFAASNGLTLNSKKSETTTAQHKGHEQPQWLKIVLHKDANQVATGLHITKQQLFADLSAGKSLDDLASLSNVSQSQLEGNLQTMIQSDLQARVSANHMKLTREAKLLKRLDAQLPKFMANKHIIQKPRKFEAGMHMLNFVAAKLQMTRVELIGKLKTGESISQIATSQGVSPSTLQSDITQNLDSQINTRAGKLLTKSNWFQHKGATTSVSTVTTGK